MSNSRNYGEKTLKKLCLLSRNVCYFRGCEEVLYKPEWDGVRAEICHIRGLNPMAARFDPTLSVKELNRFENLILLCPNHHQLVDDLEPQEWPTERLDGVKASHEQTRPGDLKLPSDVVERFAELLLLAVAVAAGTNDDSGTVRLPTISPAEAMQTIVRMNGRLEAIIDQASPGLFHVPDLADERIPDDWFDAGRFVLDRADGVKAFLEHMRDAESAELLEQVHDIVRLVQLDYDRVPGC